MICFLLNGSLIFHSSRTETVSRRQQFIRKLLDFFLNRAFKNCFLPAKPLDSLFFFCHLLCSLFLSFKMQKVKQNHTHTDTLPFSDSKQKENLYVFILESIALVHAGRPVHEVEITVKNLLLGKYLNVWLHLVLLKPILRSRFCSE